MSKFKIGDKVKCIDSGMIHFTKNDIYKVVKVDGDFVSFIDDDGLQNDWRIDDAVKFFKVKTTKKQRIEALEKEVSELKLIVHELRERPQIKITTDLNNATQGTSAINTVKDKPLTQNQQRAAIIEKAKNFVEEHSKGTDIVINDEYQVVTAIYYDGENVYKESALCHPNGVYNEHIGKAIALGRALGLDVSQFEQAVKPTEFAVGQIVQSRLTKENKIHVVRVENGCAYDRFGDYWPDYALEEDCFISNDTDAIYR